MEIKRQFWDRLDKEILQAENYNCGIILQMGGNLHGGPELISGDPNPQNYKLRKISSWEIDDDDDQNGVANEILKPGIVGNDLDFSNITSIYKGKEKK